MKAIALAALALTLAAPAAAQSWSSSRHDAERPGGGPSYGSSGRYETGHRRGYDFNGQADRPGDYRCDAYWDAGRNDCGAAWRDQRSHGRPYDGGWSNRAAAYGFGHGRYGSYGGGRVYGQGVGHAYQPYDQGSQYYGAYGRPDQVYPGDVGRAGGYGDRGRASYCAARYRSYDPHSGYYRAYSGQLIYCG